MEYVKNVSELYHNMEKVEELTQKIIIHGRVWDAITTGQKYQRITKEDQKIILENLDQLYNTYGNISNNALSLQAETVMIKEEFQKSVKECK